MKKALDVNWVARELGAAEKILFMPGNGGIVLKKEDNGWSVQLEQPWMVGRAVGRIRAHSAEKQASSCGRRPPLKAPAPLGRQGSAHCRPRPAAPLMPAHARPTVASSFNHFSIACTRHAFPVCAAQGIQRLSDGLGHGKRSLFI